MDIQDETLSVAFISCTDFLLKVLSEEFRFSPRRKFKIDWTTTALVHCSYFEGIEFEELFSVILGLHWWFESGYCSSD